MRANQLVKTVSAEPGKENGINFKKLLSFDTLGSKLMGAFLFVGLAPLLVVAVMSASKAGDALEKQAFNQLESVRAIKKGQIEKFFDERRGDIAVLTETVRTLRSEAVNKLIAVREIKKKQLTDYFDTMRTQILVLKDDPFVNDGLSSFDNAFKLAGGKTGTEDWNALAEIYDPRLKGIMTKNGWYDIFLINNEGSIVYTVTREPDLGLNIPNSELKDSSFGKAFAKIQDMDIDKVAVSDLAPYAPSKGVPAAFMIAKVTNIAGEQTGYVAFQIPQSRVNSIMGERAGLGETGETILVGPDYLMRSDSYRDPVNRTVVASFATPAKGKVNTIATRNVHEKGISGVSYVIDYMKNPTIIAYTPVQIAKDLVWGLNAKVDIAEAFVPKIKGDKEDFYTKYNNLYGYYDLFLINPDGYVFYSVAREADYQTNMVSGKYKDSNLGELVREVVKSGKYGFADFKPYAPSNMEPAAFIAQPVMHEGAVEMIVALQISLGAINGIMQERAGMGETGETYLIGPDKLMRSDSFLDQVNHTVVASFANPTKGSVDTEGAREAIAGKTGSKIITDYNGNPVLSSYAPVKVGDTSWGLMAEIDEAEAFGAIIAIEWMMAIVGIVGAILIAALAMMIARAIVGPVKNTVGAIKEIAAGDFTQEIEVKSKDEIGELSQAVNGMVVELREMFINISENSRTLATSAEELSSVSTQLAGGSEEMSSQASTVASATEQMSSNINSMASAVEESSVNASSVASTAEQMSTNMNTISSAIEEMTVSISDVSKNSQDTAKIASQANELANGATTTMKALGESANEIGKVTDMIKRIAEQTNLLALNATIEAASAGDAGKGFAVVANEIKELANQSAQAAEEIANKINGVQTSTNSAVTVISDVSEIIVRINEAVDVISHAVDQQTKAANEIASTVAEASNGSNNIASSISEVAKGSSDMSRNAGEAAKGANEVSSNIQGINKAVTDNNAGIQQINSSTRDLARIAGDLETMMNRFKVENNGRSADLSLMPAGQDNESRG